MTKAVAFNQTLACFDTFDDASNGEQGNKHNE